MQVLDGHRLAAVDSAWSPDGRLLTVSEDGTARVWTLDVEGEPSSVTLRGHLGPIEKGAWGPNGRVLTLSVADNTARVWDLGASDPEPVVLTHPTGVLDAAWTPDGRVGTTDLAGTARVWTLDRDALLRHARSRVLAPTSEE